MVPRATDTPADVTEWESDQMTRLNRSLGLCQQDQFKPIRSSTRHYYRSRYGSLSQPGIGSSNGGTDHTGPCQWNRCTTG